jgi:hypothetical protein
MPKYNPDLAYDPRTWQDTGGENLRECSRGDRCSGYSIENGHRVPAQTPRAFCDKDARWITACLLVLPGCYDALERELGEKSGTRERVSGSRTPPVPVRLDIDALLREHVHILSSWHERVAAAANLDFPYARVSRLRRDRQAVHRAVDVIAPRMSALFALEPGLMTRYVRITTDTGGVKPGDAGFVRAAAGYAEVDRELSGADAGEDILRLYGKAVHVLGQFLEREEMGAPCPKCDSLTMISTAGEDRLQCAMCKYQPDEKEYARWTKLLTGGSWYVAHMSLHLKPLLALGPGWDGHRARPVTREAADGVHAVIIAFMRREFAPPQYFPLPGGGIQVEWHAGDEITIKVDGSGAAYVLAVKANGETVADAGFDAAHPGETGREVRDLLAVISRRVFAARLPGLQLPQGG